MNEKDLPPAGGVSVDRADVLVFVIESDRSFGYSLHTQLTKFGMGVRLFDNEDRCIRSLGEKKPQVIIVGIPPNDPTRGKQITAYLAKSGLAIPVVGYTGELDPNLRKVLIEQLGLADLLSHPFHILDLLRTITERTQPKLVEKKPAAPKPAKPRPQPAQAAKDPVKLRRHLRVPIRVNVTIADGDELRRSWTGNISESGMFIETEEAGEFGEEITVEMILPVIGEVLSLTGKVVFERGREMCRPGENPGMGIEFSNTTLGEKQALSLLSRMVSQGDAQLLDKAPETVARRLAVCCDSNLFDELVRDIERFKHVEVARMGHISQLDNFFDGELPHLLLCDINSVPDWAILIEKKQTDLAHLPVVLASPKLELAVVLDLLDTVDDVIELPVGMSYLINNVKSFLCLRQRSAPRIQCSYNSTVDFGDSRSFVDVREISPGGAEIWADGDRPIPLNEELQFVITVPEISGKLRLTGKALRSFDPLEGKRPYGVEFTGMDAENKERLEELVRDKLSAINYLRWMYYPL